MWNQQSAPMQPSSSTAAGPAAASTAMPAAAYAQAFAQAAENVPRPPVPAVLTVADRGVYVENVELPPPGYTLARRWVRNEPEVDVESIVGPAQSAFHLPRPLELSLAGVKEPEALVDDVDDYNPEQAVVDLKRHWVRQRKHATTLRLRRVERYRDRLKLVAAANTLAVTQLLAAQAAQHQQQQQGVAALQHQQLLQLQQLSKGVAVSQALQQQQQHPASVLLQLPPHALAAGAAAEQQQEGVKQETAEGTAAAYDVQQGDPAAAEAQELQAASTADLAAMDAAAIAAAIDPAAIAAAVAAAAAAEAAALGLQGPPAASTQLHIDALTVGTDGMQADALLQEAQYQQQQLAAGFQLQAGADQEQPAAADMAVDG